MSYRWWVWLHVAGVLVFVGAHGVSMAVSFKVRKERDPGRVMALLELSVASTRWMYVGQLLLIGAGVVAGFKIHAWGAAWLWTAIAVLVATIVVMYSVASLYYVKLRTVTQAILDGSEAVSPAQFADLLSSKRPFVLALVGGLALLVILWLMLLKPF